MLLRKPRAYAEIYNDLDGEVVNLFRVARDDGESLAQACELTPFARAEFSCAYDPADEPLEQARRTLIRAYMGFGSAGASGQPTGFRANSNRSGTTPAHDWMNYPDCLRQVVQRLRGVVIENRDAAACMRQHDGPETCITSIRHMCMRHATFGLVLLPTVTRCQTISMSCWPARCEA